MEKDEKNQRFSDIGKGMTDLLITKNSGYGDSYDKVPRILKIMFEDEASVDLDKVYFIAHLLEKLQRYIASDKIDSVNDAIGYCMLERSRYPTEDFLADPGNELSAEEKGSSHLSLTTKGEPEICKDVFWREVLDFYGIDFRVSKAIEELTELKCSLMDSQTARKNFSSNERRAKARENVLREMADVKITLMALRPFFDPNGERFEKAEKEKMEKFVTIFEGDKQFPKGSE